MRRLNGALFGCGHLLLVSAAMTAAFAQSASTQSTPPSAQLKAPTPTPGITLDRTAITMGREVITESRLILELKVSAFLDRLPVDLSTAARHKAAERLIDQTLILREATESRLEIPTPDPAALVNQVKLLYPSDTQYRADLARYGITEQELSAHLVAGSRTQMFADLRFRAAAQVTEEAMHEYYDKLTQARQAMTPPQRPQVAGEKPRPTDPAAAHVPTFEESRADIETLLSEQKSLDALDEWLKKTRATAQIEIHERAFASEQAPQP